MKRVLTYILPAAVLVAALPLAACADDEDELTEETQVTAGPTSPSEAETEETVEGEEQGSQRPAFATLYLRPDGGNVGQCTGLVDAPYPGNGDLPP